jgi:hypothetical protein
MKSKDKKSSSDEGFGGIEKLLKVLKKNLKHF